MRKVLAKCPICASSLRVSELSCEACHTEFRGQFERCRYCSLEPEHLQFLDVFLAQRGNLSAVGAALGLSFPTVARRLDALLTAAGLRAAEEPRPAAHDEPVPAAREVDRRAILDALDRGEISAEEATRRLKDI